MPKLTGKLSTKNFILSHLLILILGLGFLAALFYILNIQYQRPKNPYSGLGEPVTTPPKSLRIDLKEPADDQLVYKSSIIISGKTAPYAEVLISQERKDLVIKSNSSGDFSTVLNLDEGVNIITAVVFDVTGDARSEQRTVYYSKEKI